MESINTRKRSIVEFNTERASHLIETLVLKALVRTVSPFNPDSEATKIKEPMLVQGLCSSFSYHSQAPFLKLPYPFLGLLELALCQRIDLQEMGEASPQVWFREMMEDNVTEMGRLYLTYRNMSSKRRLSAQEISQSDFLTWCQKAMEEYYMMRKRLVPVIDSQLMHSFSNTS